MPQSKEPVQPGVAKCSTPNQRMTWLPSSHTDLCQDLPKKLEI